MRAPRSASLALLAATALLAGCLQGGAPAAEDAPGGAGPAGPEVFAFPMQGCRAVIAALPVPASRLAPHLPEGWRPLSMAQIGLGMPGAPNPTADGNLGVEMFVCDEVAGLDGPIAGASYGAVWTMVEPPEEFRREGVDFHFVKWDTAVPDPALRARLRAAGAPATSAAAAFDEFALLPGGATRFAGSIAFEEGWSAGFAGSAAAPFPPTGSGVEYTPVPAGFVEWYLAWTWDPVAIGPVQVRLEGPSLAADILGAAQAEGTAFAGVVRFDEATATLPPG